jgi:hypothetical protein
MINESDQNVIFAREAQPERVPTDLRAKIEQLRNDAAVAAGKEMTNESLYAYYRGYVRAYEHVLVLLYEANHG